MAKAKKEKVNEDMDEKLLLDVKIKELQKRFGLDAMHMANTEPDVDRIPFGIKELDDKIGGGIPRRRFSIFWGAESTGKSSACLHLIASAQKMGLVCAYLDLENKFEKEWATTLGVDNTKLLIGHFDHAEQSLDTFLELCRTRSIDLFIVDSIQALSPKEEREKKSGELQSTEQKSIALLPRVLGQFFRMSSTDVFKGNTAVLLIGQVRTGGIGSFFTHAELTGGACFDLETKIVTKDGFKGHEEIKIGDIVPTYNTDKKRIEYKPVKNIYHYDSTPTIVKFEDKLNRQLLFTENHTCFCKAFDYGSLGSKKYIEKKAGEYYRTFAFPICFPSGNKEYNISDNTLRILGWVLTDSGIRIANKEKNNYNNSIVIYQTKYTAHIKSLLDKSQFSYISRERHRIDKREEFKNAKPSTEFYFYNAKEIIDNYDLNIEKSIPDWMSALSDRQANILIDEMMLADGTSKMGFKRNITKGNFNWIQKFIIFCITHNIPISKYHKQKNKNCFNILFRNCDYIGFSTKTQKETIVWNKPVWDIEVEDNPIHFIERRGVVCATHNSLKHNSSMTLFVRKGQGADAPVEKYKETYIDEETGKERYRTKDRIVGFDAVIKVEKKKVPNCVYEGTEIHVPFYYSNGFVKPVEGEVKDEDPVT